MEKFCSVDGTEPFWDWNLTLSHTSPDVPRCFQLSVLALVPCALLLLFSLPYYLYLTWHNNGYIQCTHLNRAKTIIAALLWFICWLELFYTVWEKNQGRSQPTVLYVSPLIMGTMMLVALVLIQCERLHGVQSSGFMLIFWFLSLLFAIVPFRSLILAASRPGAKVDALRYFTFYTYFWLVALQFLLSCFSDRRPLFSQSVRDPNPCPEMSATFLSKMTFWWFTSLAMLGYKRPLRPEDLWSINPSDTSDNIVPRMQCLWKEELARVHKRRLKKKMQTVKWEKPPETLQDGDHFRPIDGTKDKGENVKKIEEGEILILGENTSAEESRPSLVRVLIRLYGSYYLVGSLYKFAQDLLAFASPQILSLLIGFVQAKDSPAWQGYTLSLLLFCTAFTQTLLLHQYFHICFTTGMRLKTAIVGTIYRKALVITNAVKRTSTVGEIVNLMSVDAQRFMDLTTYLSMVWSAPLQIMMAMYFLWQYLGASVLAGVAVMVLLLPVNGCIAVRTKNLQVEQMRYKDERIKLMSEILNGIRVLKLHAWEPSFRDKVLVIRQNELRTLRSIAYLHAVSTFAWVCAPFLVALTTFAVFVLVDKNNVMDAKTAFVSLTLFNLLRFPLNMLPQVISSLVQANVSLKRLQRFLANEELDPDNVLREKQRDGLSISVDHGSFAWGKSEQPVLNDVSLKVPTGTLIAIVGHVGCGKSSLISAVLGELERVSGFVAVQGSVAFVPQQAWIQNATLRDNIVFGNVFKEKWYHRVLAACALLPDLDILPAGDMTEIGEKGINLSGGQKQRISLARAVYNRAAIYLLDDPLSAVDAHVGKHIFDQLIGPEGLLKDETRVLVTHGLSFLPQMHHIVVLVSGRVTESGSYQELQQQDGAFAEFLRSYAQIEETQSQEESLTPPLTPRSNASSREGAKRHHVRGREASDVLKRNPSLSDHPQEGLEVKGKDGEQTGEKLIEDEKAETGRVKLSVFLEYLRAVGIWLAVIILLLFACQHGATIGANFWLSAWSNDASMNMTEEEAQANTRRRLGVYGAFGGVQGLMVISCSFLLALGALRAANTLHHVLLSNNLRAPLYFFDVTPLGRIINRFSKDINVVDEVLMPIFLMFLGTAFNCISTFVVVMVTTPMFGLVMLPLAVLFVFVQRFYVASSRQLKRLESVSRSPIYSHFNETVMGASVIRAYGKQESFVGRNDSLVDDNHRSYYASITANRWLAVRLEAVGNCVVLFASFFAVFYRDTLSPGLVGLSITYALQVTMSLSWMVRMSSELETNIVAVERIKEYAETPTEAPWLESKRPPDGWPSEGHVEFHRFSVRYRQGLDLVLKNLSFNISGGEKIGIVGRTGAGKSSLALCLFRIIEAAEGKICIDDLDISTIGLGDLRSRLTIIPQDPVLFSGTLRMNLDPFGSLSDEDVWRALQLAHLSDFILSLPDGLQHICTEGGENLSVGQRQLVCLARALLRKSRLLILDEATAAVDLKTDDLIQNTIRVEFHDCTVLTIAHRLNTIMDYTRVIVLDHGEIAEFDSPTALLAKRGVFYNMARDAGLV
uniref:multidrug resistance-associated protein 1-like isoform X1 n=1 Tax=Myxine glutinosa TaxID=7769 RepID=UPI00358F56A6